MDVARKLVILGREMGLELELERRGQVESLVPEPLRGCDAGEFLERAAEFDAHMQQRLREARAAGEVLRYVGAVEADGRASVRLAATRAPRVRKHRAHRQHRAVPHRALRENPLIVQGPGAGPEVTAAASSRTCYGWPPTSGLACERLEAFDSRHRLRARHRRQRRRRLRHARPHAQGGRRPGDRHPHRRARRPHRGHHRRRGAGPAARPGGEHRAAGLLRLSMEELALPFGFEVEVEKGIPLGSGMGGSAASAVAAVVAAAALLPEPLARRTCSATPSARRARSPAARYHADNLAPCLLGGLVLVRPASTRRTSVRIPVPPALRCVLVHPHAARGHARRAAGAPERRPARRARRQAANLAGLIAGCYRGDLELIGRSLADTLVEPHRAPLVRGFARGQARRAGAGALGCSLSGSGPSVFAWCEGERRGAEIRERMVEAFAAAGVARRGWVSPVDAPGARIERTG
jgi:homoserine kinase